MASCESARAGLGCADYRACYHSDGNLVGLRGPEHRRLADAGKHTLAANLSGPEVDTHICTGWPPAEQAGRLEDHRDATGELLSGRGRLDKDVDELESGDPPSRLRPDTGTRR